MPDSDFIFMSERFLAAKRPLVERQRPDLSVDSERYELPGEEPCVDYRRRLAELGLE